MEVVLGKFRQKDYEEHVQPFGAQQQHQQNHILLPAEGRVESEEDD